MFYYTNKKSEIIDFKQVNIYDLGKQLNNLRYVYQPIRTFCDYITKQTPKLCNYQQQMWKYTQLNYKGLAIYNSYLHVVIICNKNNTVYICDKFILLTDKDKLMIKL